MKYENKIDIFRCEKIYLQSTLPYKLLKDMFYQNITVNQEREDIITSRKLELTGDKVKGIPGTNIGLAKRFVSFVSFFSAR